MTALTDLNNPSARMTPLVCPTHLTAEHRIEFRRDALNALESAFEAGESTVVLDLGGVVSIDASGLGVLILLQKRARERKMRISLLAVPSIVEKLFEDTRMGPLFDIVRAA